MDYTVVERVTAACRQITAVTPALALAIEDATASLRGLEALLSTAEADELARIRAARTAARMKSRAWMTREVARLRAERDAARTCEGPPRDTHGGPVA